MSNFPRKNFKINNSMKDLFTETVHKVNMFYHQISRFTKDAKHEILLKEIRETIR